jgi:hypothetical protein
MSDPKRLREASPHTFDRALLAAADTDAPPLDGEARALAALGLAVAGAGAAATAHGAGTAQAATKIVTLAVLKWAGVGLLATATTAGTVTYVVSASESHETAPPITEPAAVRRASPTTNVSPAPVAAAPPIPDPIPIPDPTPTPTPVPTRTPTPSPMATPIPTPTEAVDTSATPTVAPAAIAPEELRLIDAARAALRVHDGPAALRALDEYDARFASGQLREEADVARIEALLDVKDAPRAAAQARAFLEAHPSSAYERRVHALLKRATNP